MHLCKAGLFYLLILLVTLGEVESAERILSKRHASLTLGRKENLTTVTPGTLTWRSTDSTVVSVNNSVITGKRTGSASIVVHRVTGDVYDTCSVTVVPWAAGVTNLRVDPVLENLNLFAMRNDTLYLKGSGSNYRWRSIYYYAEGMAAPQLLSDFGNDGTFPTDAEQILPTPFGVFALAKRETQNSMRKIYRMIPGVPGATMVYDRFPPSPLAPNLSYTLQQGWDFDQQGNIYLGEYNTQSVNNYSIRLFKGSNFGQSWQDVVTFPPRSIGGLDGGVRHVHACQVDPYDGRVWISTGDENMQSRIYYSDNELRPDADGVVRPKLLGGGSQEFRTVSFAFTQGFIYWFMDAGCDSQKIFRIPRASSYVTLTPATLASMDYRQVVGVFKDKPFYNNVTIHEGTTSTILVETVFEDNVRYRCASPEPDRRNRIFAIRERGDGSFQTQEVLSTQALVVNARMMPVGQDSRGNLYFNSSYCGDTNGVQIYRGQLQWNDVDQLNTVAGASGMDFPNAKIALEGSFTAGRKVLVSRTSGQPDLPGLPPGAFAVGAYFWQISADAGPFFNGRISALRSDLTGFLPGDSLIWMARTDPGGSWIDIGGRTQNGSLVSEQECSAYSEFTVAAASFAITASASSGGTITPSGTIIIPRGSSASFAIHPDAGYHIDSVIIDGVNAGPVQSHVFTNVSAPHTIVAWCSINRYAITANAGPGGSITPSGIVMIEHGAPAVFAITPESGFHLVALSVDGVAVDSTSSFTFASVSANHEISAGFAASHYVLDATAGPHATISPSGSTTVDAGAGLNFQMSASAGYHIDSVTVDGIKTDSITSYTFSNVLANHTISVTASIDRFSITAVPDVIMRPGGALLADYGSSVVFRIFPPVGTYIDSLIVDGVKVDSTESYTFHDIRENHEIRAVVAALKFTIVTESGPNGSITPPGNTIVEYGANQAYTLIPDPGYHVDSLLADDAKIDSFLTYTFVNVTADHLLRAVFAVDQHTVTITAGENGSATPSGVIGVSDGAELMCRFFPDPGYHVASVLVDDVAVDSVAGYTFSDIIASHTLSVNFGLNAYTISAGAGEHGTVTPNGEVTVSHGGSQAFLFAPDPGYHIDSVIVDGRLADPTAVYTFTEIASGHSIRVTFAIDRYIIRTTYSAGGKMEPEGPVDIASGEDVTFIITPSEGYHIEQVEVDGVDQGAVAEYSFRGVVADHSIHAIFAINSYVITATAGPNGSIIPEGQVTVTHGSSQTFTLRPETGYHIDTLVVDGAFRDTSTDVVFERIDANHVLSATFAINHYSIIASAGANGAIAPSGTIDAVYGDTRTFTFTPAIGFQVDSVIVDGIFVGRNSSHTVPGISADHTIRVVFGRIPPPVGEMAVVDDFNGPAITSLNGLRKWVAFTRNEAGGSMQRNNDSTISPVNPTLLSRGGVAWDSLLSDGARIGLVVKQKGGNSTAISCFYLYFRMSGRDLQTSTGYCLLYAERPTMTDLIYLMRAASGNSLTLLATLNHEVVAGDTLVVKVEADKTMKALVYGVNGIRDSISVVDNTYNPSQWYSWIRGVVLPTPVKMDNFMVGPISLALQARSTPAFVEPSEKPSRYALEQNYPNPFNPATSIAYSLPGPSLVTLRVFNLLGQEVAVLRNGALEEGYRSVESNFSGLTSGVYFYRLEATSAGDPEKRFVQTRTMILMK